MIRFLDEDYLRGHEKLKAYIQRFEVRRHSFNPFFAKLSYLNFNPLEVVSRYRDSQLQVGENVSYMSYLRPNI